MQAIVHQILPAILTLGLIGYGVKNYFHFKYLKIIKKHPKESTFWEFNRNILPYFKDNIVTFLPFSIRQTRTKLPPEKYKKAQQYERTIKICLTLFYLGLSTIPLGIKLQETLP